MLLIKLFTPLLVELLHSSFRTHSLVLSDLHSETKGSQFEVSSLQEALLFKCLWSKWKWWRVIKNDILLLTLLTIRVGHKCSWIKTQIEKNDNILPIPRVKSLRLWVLLPRCLNFFFFSHTVTFFNLLE